MVKASIANAADQEQNWAVLKLLAAIKKKKIKYNEKENKTLDKRHKQWTTFHPSACLPNWVILIIYSWKAPKFRNLGVRLFYNKKYSK